MERGEIVSQSCSRGTQRADSSVMVAFALIAFIVIAVWAYKVWLYPRPFWCANTDVEVEYFFNGLQVAAGKSPVNFVHPGTPIQYLSGLLSWLTHAQPADMQLIGQHHVVNALAEIAAADSIGASVSAIEKAFATFQNVKRRLEVRGCVNNITVYDDFAHHPTA